MPRKQTILTEDIVDSAGNSVPEPVDTGNPHALRPQDNLQGDQDVAIVSGQEISRSAILSALLSKLVGMDGAQLQQVATAMSLTVDVVANPTAGTTLDNAAAANLATISTKEDVEEIFAGEELSEEFKTKTQVIFEAAVQARAALIEAAADERVQAIAEEYDIKFKEIEKKSEEEVRSAVDGVTEELVDQLDKYLSFVAEEFVEKNKLEIDSTSKSVLAEEVLSQIANVVQRYVVVSDTIDPLNDLAEQVESLKAELKAERDARIDEHTKLKDFRRKEIISESSSGMNTVQRARLEQLCEALAFNDEGDFINRVQTIKESIQRKDEAATRVSIITESAIPDGVAPLTDDVSAASAAPVDEGVKSVLSFLQRSAT